MITSSPGDGGVVKRPPRSLHLPARNPSSCTNFVVLVSPPLLGLCPASCGAAGALSRVALSRAARMPVLTRVRRRFADVTRLCRGELLGVEGLDDLLGVRARVRAPGLSSRPGMGTSGLEIGPTISASAALRRCGVRRGLGLPRVPRRRPSPAACLEPS